MNDVVGATSALLLVKATGATLTDNLVAGEESLTYGFDRLEKIPSGELVALGSTSKRRFAAARVSPDEVSWKTGSTMVAPTDYTFNHESGGYFVVKMGSTGGITPSYFLQLCSYR